MEVWSQCRRRKEDFDAWVLVASKSLVRVVDLWSKLLGLDRDLIAYLVSVFGMEESLVFCDQICLAID